MTDRNIVPDKITKPIQLLAAWLAGLILVNGSFLGTAVAFDAPSGLRTALVLASIVNVPVFLFFLFLLQTKFRPEMQEDSYYAKYLESNTGKVTVVNSVDAIQDLRASVLESNQTFTAMLGGLSVELRALSVSASSKVADGGGDAAFEHATEMMEVAHQAEASAKAVERIISRSSENVTVQVNDLLPNFEAVRSELNSNKIKIDGTFGSTSHQPETPSVLILTFGRGVPIEFLRRVVKICRPLGFERIHFASEDINANRVFIGSYIYRAPKEPQPVALDSKLMSLIDSPTADLYQIIGAISSSRATPPTPRLRGQ